MTRSTAPVWARLTAIMLFAGAVVLGTAVAASAAPAPAAAPAVAGSQSSSGYCGAAREGYNGAYSTCWTQSGSLLHRVVIRCSDGLGIWTFYGSWQDTAHVSRRYCPGLWRLVSFYNDEYEQD